MGKFKHNLFVVGIMFCSIAILIGCRGYQGHSYEKKPDGNIGTIISGVNITFVKEDGRFRGSHAWATPEQTSEFYRLTGKK